MVISIYCIYKFTCVYLQLDMLNTTNMAFIQSLSQFISSGISYRRDPAPSPYILSTSPPDASMELYVLEHRLQVCFIPKNAIADFCHAIMKIALLPDSRYIFSSSTSVLLRISLKEREANHVSNLMLMFLEFRIFKLFIITFVIFSPFS